MLVPGCDKVEVNGSTSKSGSGDAETEELIAHSNEMYVVFLEKQNNEKDPQKRVSACPIIKHVMHENILLIQAFLRFTVHHVPRSAIVTYA